MGRHTPARYSALSKGLHWLLALLILGLFALGLWMVGLDYYHPWYHRAPDWHRSLGVVAVLLMAVRGLWLVSTGKPPPLASHRPWEIVLARLAHGMMYLLVFAIGISGYLMATADGRALDVFTWFALPSSGEWVADQEDVAGEIHEWLAFGLMALVALHSLAAMKHHLIDRDETLKRML